MRKWLTILLAALLICCPALAETADTAPTVEATEAADAAAPGAKPVQANPGPRRPGGFSACGYGCPRGGA